ncbi:nuclear factor NF-kappa-B family member relish [Cochliomyia hominivorax]
MENNMLPYGMTTSNNKDIIDMDTLEPIRRISESSMGGTSGYNSTTSPGPGNSPLSNGYSPVPSPASGLPAEFSNLIIPTSYEQNTNTNTQYIQLQNVQQQHINIDNNLYQTQNHDIQFSPAMNFGNPLNYQLQQSAAITTASFVNPVISYPDVKYEYEAKLQITEQPVEKFRFRYKSEMHGTHGSLNGTNSRRNIKTFPEVQLSGYKGPAIIRCSLFQTIIESPHSHQLVVRKDDHDICDPHELKVSEEVGYFAEFKNMGIIHTAKKFIVEELLKKKRKRLARETLTTKEEQELYKQTEKEAKDMNLNQVRLCFEAFRVEENNSYTPIAAPVYSNPINNRKSAQTGELRITRLSIATGNVAGGDDLILLVEKVSKKNIKVRFFEMVDDEQVWEAFASFRESDVHHQYAIVCRTPPYKDKEIDKAVEVFIELVRPSDDERSYPPVSFRYKPNHAAMSRKRRRTCSSLNSSSCSNSGSLSSGDIPKTVQEQQQLQQQLNSDDINNLLSTTEFKSDISFDCKLFDNISDIANDLLTNIPGEGGRLEKDSICINNDNKKFHHYKKAMISKKQMDIARQQPFHIYIQRILTIFNDTIRNTTTTPLSDVKRECAAQQITKIFNEHAEKYSESLIHDFVANDNSRFAIPILRVLEFFKLNDLLNTVLNKRSQTPLHYCCLYGQPNYIRPLLKMGCKPDIQDADGNTALHIAVAENQLKCLDSFINAEIPFKLNELNDDGYTPLHIAIRHNKLDFVAKILKHDAASTLTTKCEKDGFNALHMAVQQQNLDLIKLILEYSSSTILYAKNRAGLTALDLAKQLATGDEQARTILNLLLTHYNKYQQQQQPQQPMDKNLKMDIEFTAHHSDDGENDEEDEENNKKLVIKEEENSSSSNEDDDEDSNSINTTNDNIRQGANTPPLTIPNIRKIKKEYPDEDDITLANSLTITDLEMTLNDKDICLKLCEELNKNDNWKLLANEMNIKLLFLTNAEGVLSYLRRNLKDINCSQLEKSLKNIDKNLLNIFKK